MPKPQSPLKVITTDIKISDDNLSPSKVSEKEAGATDFFNFAQTEAPASPTETSQTTPRRNSESQRYSRENQFRSDAGQNLRSSLRGHKSARACQSNMPLGSPPTYNKSFSDTSPNISSTLLNSKDSGIPSVQPKLRSNGQGLVTKKHQRPFSSASLYNHQSFTSLPRNKTRDDASSKLSVFDVTESLNPSPRNSIAYSSVPPQIPTSRMFRVHTESDYCTMTHMKPGVNQLQKERVKTKTKATSPLAGVAKDGFHCSAPFSVNAPNSNDTPQNVTVGSKEDKPNSFFKSSTTKGFHHSSRHSNNPQRKVHHHNPNQIVFYRGAPTLLASAYQNACDVYDIYDSEHYQMLQQRHEEFLRCSNFGSSSSSSSAAARRPLSLTNNCVKCGGTEKPTASMKPQDGGVGSHDLEHTMYNEDSSSDLRPNSMIDLGLHVAVPRGVHSQYYQILTKCEETETESDGERVYDNNNDDNDYQDQDETSPFRVSQQPTNKVRVKQQLKMQQHVENNDENSSQGHQVMVVATEIKKTKKEFLFLFSNATLTSN